MFGAGAIGCLFLAVFRAAGAGPIVVVEPQAARAAVAAGDGRGRGGHARRAGRARREPCRAAPMSWSMPWAACSGPPSARRHGRPDRVFGMNANARRPIHQVEITERSLTIMGTYITDFTFPEAIRLLESGG